MYTINRNIEEVLIRRANNSKITLLVGARQVGKSTMLKHVFNNITYVTLRDPLILAAANDDPKLFLSNYSYPLIIDEAQKCKKLFDYLMLIVDDVDTYKNFILSGSNKIELIKNSSDSLAGRVSIMDLECLSTREIYGVTFNKHFVPTQTYLQEREKQLVSYKDKIWELIHRGFYPELHANTNKEWLDFYSEYVETYIERDVKDYINASNKLTFVKFLSCVAARTGQILNKANIADDVGVSEDTISKWINILQQTNIIYLLKAYAPTELNRAKKSPKLYFRDTGLCCYLLRWLTPETLKFGAMAGAMFETFVVNEILKSYSNEGIDYDFGVYYYCGKDKKKIMKDGEEHSVDGEIDFVIEENGILYPIEIKMTENPKAIMAHEFDVLDKIKDNKRGMGVILCMYDKKVYLKDNLIALPVWYI